MIIRKLRRIVERWKEVNHACYMERWKDGGSVKINLESKSLEAFELVVGKVYQPQGAFVLFFCSNHTRFPNDGSSLRPAEI